MSGRESTVFPDPGARRAALHFTVCFPFLSVFYVVAVRFFEITGHNLPSDYID